MFDVVVERDVGEEIDDFHRSHSHPYLRNLIRNNRLPDNDKRDMSSKFQCLHYQLNQPFDSNESHPVRRKGNGYGVDNSYTMKCR